ncbi:hypothetical protein B0T18DRAFT_386317 [Schizothecium vesticola]|uniref:Heterokaryon incompatibility domain-containing protein n=1 Tax=Schizothecium vesticola TaxID=314040 RepID=A0AA40KCS8_9PEZI|nr:hypothetical protein B0T18DRAFT_386317 [Schizothecium vesticola]
MASTAETPCISCKNLVLANKTPGPRLTAYFYIFVTKADYSGPCSICSVLFAAAYIFAGDTDLPTYHCEPAAEASVDFITTAALSGPFTQFKPAPLIAKHSDSPQCFAQIHDWMAVCDASHDDCRVPAAVRLPTRVVDVIPTPHGLRPVLVTSNGDPDALTIIQDDEDDWHAEAAKMAIVYGNAHVTIAATHSQDLDAGIFAPRDFTARYYRVWPLPEQLTPKPSPVDELRDARATEAEPTLEILGISARKGHPGMYYLDTAVLPPRSEIDAATRNYLSEYWVYVVENYSTRRLTQESDKLVALSGVADALSASGMGPHHAGKQIPGVLTQNSSYLPSTNNDKIGGHQAALARLVVNKGQIHDPCMDIIDTTPIHPGVAPSAGLPKLQLEVICLQLGFTPTFADGRRWATALVLTRSLTDAGAYERVGIDYNLDGRCFDGVEETEVTIL